MDLKQALEVALAKEKASRALYDNMANKYPAVKELCLGLMNEEEKHIEMIKNKLAEVLRG